ncbi:MAG: hypothetical protein KDD82_19425 [Planctomycetes bacterium]|nr:hypothetical protein [Planctomycetota bacterium]
MTKTIALTRSLLLLALEALNEKALDGGGMLQSMPKRTKVSVNRPRKGRDRGQWRLRVRYPDGRDTHQLSGVDWSPASRQKIMLERVGGRW